jgi:pimeloyl-ACP methyl ester carboxylesterase
MPSAVIDGITTRYEVIGSGPALLMYSPGGFDATIEKWSSLGIYSRTKPLHHLSRSYTCIAFDRRECGQSGGRVERVTWNHHGAQGRGLLRHLGIARAHVMGGCMGVCSATSFAVAYPDVTLSLVLVWPVGGAKYRIAGHERFARHLAYVHENGLEGVVALAKTSDKSFGQDPRVGPWGTVIRADPSFAGCFLDQDIERYKCLVASMGRTLIDRDTAPGAEPEDLLRTDIPALIIPGNDASHATSAARYLEECLPRAEYWDVDVEDQSEECTSARLLKFLQEAHA